MNDPISELVAKAVFDRLRTVRKANGYNVDLEVIRFNRKTGHVSADDRAIIHELGDEPIQDESQMHEEWRKEFLVECFIIENDTSSVSIDERLNVIRADIEKALSIEPRTLDGNAINIELAGGERWDALDGAYFGMSVRFFVHYRTSVEDPYLTA